VGRHVHAFESPNRCLAPCSPYLARLGHSGVLMSAPPLCVGVDVANAPLDMALRPTGDRWAVANDDAGMATLVARLLAVLPTLICRFPRPIAWKSWQGIERDNTAFGSMTAGESALHGEMRRPTKSRLSITTRRWSS
jgi:hypothetical protein